MAILTLTRRKSQLELLAQLCETRTVARIAPARRPNPPAPAQTCFLAMQPDGLLIEWPATGIGEIPISGSAVDVSFEHLGQALRLRTTTRGRAWWPCPGGGQIDAWMLTLPLRIDAARRRQQYRLSLGSSGPIPARCTSVANPEATCAAELMDLSGRGLSATARGQTEWLRPNTVCWTEFELPGESRPFEFVVRVAHLRGSAASGALIFGGVFCSGDDSSFRGQQLQRIERFVAERQRPAASRTAVRPMGGG